MICYKNYISLFIALFLIGCGKEPSRDHFVVNNGSNHEMVNLDRFFQEKTFSIPFIGAKSINGKVRSFMYYNEILYLVSRQPVGKLMAVNNEGEVLFYLEANSGPNSGFSSIGGVTIDRQSEEIVIYDNIEKVFYWYDLQGVFLRKRGEDLIVNDLAVTETGCFLMDVSSEKQGFESAETDKAGVVSACSGDGEIVNTLHFNDFFREELAPFQNYSNFYQIEGSTYYHQDFTDTIYTVKEDGLSSVLSFSFKHNDRRNEILRSGGNPLLLSEMIALNVPFAYYCVPFKDYIAISYGYSGIETFAILNKGTGETLFSTNDFKINGHNINGRIDFNGGVFLNQMYLSEYNDLNNEGAGDGIQYTILIPR